MVYRSQEYASFITDQMLTYGRADGWQVSLRIVANDPADADSLLSYPRFRGVPTVVYRDRLPCDYYLNRVYRCWNFAGKNSTCSNICFVNSDMAFGPNWLSNLLRHHDGTHIPTSRLVESGKMPSGAHGISMNFGRRPAEFDLKTWRFYCDRIAQPVVRDGGLFMPVVFEKRRFVESGMYPEGNIYTDGIGTRGAFVQSGDAFFFELLASRYRMRHVTVFDSVVYHIQEGELDS